MLKHLFHNRPQDQPGQPGRSISEPGASYVAGLALCALLPLLLCACDGSHRAMPKVESKPDAAASQQQAKKTQPATEPAKDLPPALLELWPAPVLNGLSYETGEAAGFSSILESLGGGAGIGDLDNDDRPDIVLPGGGQLAQPNQIRGLPTHLVRNLGEAGLVDVSRAARIDLPLAYTHGIALADVNNDGFIDCLVTGYGRLQLFQNQGDGTLVELALAAGLTDSQWSSSAAWCDFNRDGNLDLYVCHYVNWSFEHHPYCPGPTEQQREICSPRDFAALDHVLYISQGDGLFVDGTEAWGLVRGGKGLGVVAGDVDQDGWPDIYVANDTTENFLYRNLGDRFEEIGQSAGVAYDDEGIPNGSMGVDLADYNGDLLPDLWAANYERESFALYRNEGRSMFLHVSRPAGVTALGGLFVGFGTAFLDADADGDLDVLVTNGHVIKYPQFAQRQQIPLLLVNQNNRFTKYPFANDHYFMQKHEGRGLAVGDVDGDGHLDVLINHENSPPALLRSTLGPSNRSLKCELIGTKSNRSALGAQIVLQHAQGKQLRLLSGGGSYLSSHQPSVVFELPSAWQTEKLTVKWPSGNQQEVNLARDAAGTLQIIEAETTKTN